MCGNIISILLTLQYSHPGTRRFHQTHLSNERRAAGHRSNNSRDYFGATCAGPPVPLQPSVVLIIEPADENECGSSNEDGDTRCTCLSRKQGARPKSSTRAVRDSGLMSRATYVSGERPYTYSTHLPNIQNRRVWNTKKHSNINNLTATDSVACFRRMVITIFKTKIF